MRFDLASIGANTVHAPLGRWPRLVWRNWSQNSPVVALSRYASASGGFRTLYAAEDVITVLGEVLLKSGGPAQGGMVHLDTLEQLAVIEVGSQPGIELLDLTGNATHRLGIDDHLHRRPSPAVEQHLAESLHDRTSLDGVIFNSRCERGRCLALFERSLPKLTFSPMQPLAAVEALPTLLRSLGLEICRRAVIDRS